MPAPQVVAFGELMLRLSAPGRELLLQSPRLDAWFGGAEANVAVALARLGTRSRFITALPDNALGLAASAELRRHGVDAEMVRHEPGRLGAYFVAPGSGPRASDVIYDRAGSVFAKWDDGYDWSAALRGADWLHVSGVTLAVSAAAERAAMAAIEAARSLGIRVAFDCNFRERLWSARGIDPRSTIARFVAVADLVFANHRDAGLLNGTPVTDEHGAEIGPATVDYFLDHFPQLTRIAYVTRDVESSERHRLTGALAVRGEGSFASRTWALDAIVDRIGGGDAFAAGLLHAFCKGMSPRLAIEFAVATGMLKHTLPGDMFILSEADVRRSLDGASDVRR